MSRVGVAEEARTGEQTGEGQAVGGNKPRTVHPSSAARGQPPSPPEGSGEPVVGSVGAPSGNETGGTPAEHGPWPLAATVAHILALPPGELAAYRAALAHDTEALRRADAVLTGRAR